MQPAAQNAMLTAPPLPSFTAFLPFAMDGIGGLGFSSSRKLDAFAQLSQQLHLHDHWKSMAQSLLSQRAAQAASSALSDFHPVLPFAETAAKLHEEKRDGDASELGIESNASTGPLERKKSRHSSRGSQFKERRRR